MPESSAFDAMAYRQWEDYLLPTDRDRWPALFNQIRAELTECLDYIVELEDKLAQVRL